MPDMFKQLRDRGFDVAMLHHAEAIMLHDMPEAIADIEDVLLNLKIPTREIIEGGGGEARSTQRMRKRFADLGWKKENVRVTKLVNGEEIQSLSHEIDHVKKFGGWTFALEIEWNNKDPFFDRDLESFKRLHSEGAISIGGIITRGQRFQSCIRDRLRKFADAQKIKSLQDLEMYDYNPTLRQRKMLQSKIDSGSSFVDAWLDLFLSDKFGKATTHWAKLDDRVKRGVGNPCPLLLIGIPESVLED